MSVDRSSTDRRTIDRRATPRRVHARPTGAPTGTFPRQLLRTAQVALVAGLGVAGAVAVMPAPRASESFQLAFADWRRDGAWYVGDDGRPTAPLDAPRRPTPMGAAGPVMVAEAGGAAGREAGTSLTVDAGRRLARLPAGAGGRVTDFAPAPLAASRRTAAAETVRETRPQGENVGPIVPPPSFADIPHDDSEPAPSRKPEPSATGGLPDLRRDLLEEMRGLREDVRNLSARWESLQRAFDGAAAPPGDER